jgi:hypothetical protein
VSRAIAGRTNTWNAETAEIAEKIHRDFLCGLCELCVQNVVFFYVRSSAAHGVPARVAQQAQQRRRHRRRDERHQHEHREQRRRQQAAFEADVQDDELDEPAGIEQRGKRHGVTPREAHPRSDDHRTGGLAEDGRRQNDRGLDDEPRRREQVHVGPETGEREEQRQEQRHRQRLDPLDVERLVADVAGDQRAEKERPEERMDAEPLGRRRRCERGHQDDRQSSVPVTDAAEHTAQRRPHDHQHDHAVGGQPQQ